MAAEYLTAAGLPPNAKLSEKQNEKCAAASLVSASLEKYLRCNYGPRARRTQHVLYKLYRMSPHGGRLNNPTPESKHAAITGSTTSAAVTMYNWITTDTAVYGRTVRVSCRDNNIIYIYL